MSLMYRCQTSSFAIDDDVLPAASQILSCSSGRRLLSTTPCLHVNVARAPMSNNYTIPRYVSYTRSRDTPR
jgi:hypothetical protein